MLLNENTNLCTCEVVVGKLPDSRVGRCWWGDAEIVERVDRSRIGVVQESTDAHRRAGPDLDSICCPGDPKGAHRVARNERCGRGVCIDEGSICVHTQSAQNTAEEAKSIQNK